MALSILGFNVGIELMQLFVILIIVPWLIILSEGRFYSIIRTGGALIAGVASLAWIAERTLNKPNVIGGWAQSAATGGKWIVLGLACTALLSYLTSLKKC